MTAKDRIKKSLIVLLIGVVINFGLALSKLYVGLSCYSLCILLDATNSFADIITGIVTVAAFLMLLKPKTGDTDLGYGRSEYVAGFIIAVVVVVVGGSFLVTCVDRIAMPQQIFFSIPNCMVIVATFVVKLMMALFYYFTNKKIRSKALKALTLDSLLDLGITGASVISFAVSANVNFAVDAFFGIALCCIIIIIGLKMVYDNVKTLVGNNADSDNEEYVKAACAENGRIEKVGRILLHDYGFARCIGTADVKFARDVTFEEAMEICTEISAQLKEKYNLEVEVVPKAEIEDEAAQNCGTATKETEKTNGREDSYTKEIADKDEETASEAL